MVCPAVLTQALRSHPKRLPSITMCFLKLPLIVDWPTSKKPKLKIIEICWVHDKNKTCGDGVTPHPPKIKHV